METVLTVAASRVRDPERPKLIPALCWGLIGGCGGCTWDGGGGK